MKITAPLLLLPLLLAACGTQSATPAPQSSLLGNSVRATGPTYVEAFEAGVQRDLTALGLSGSISAQATAPKSYLNVLKVSDTTARAYMKTTYPAATGCALDWGDGTALSTITTPSVVATDKADHIYSESGTYIIKLTCGTDVKTSTFAAVVPIKNLQLFETFASGFPYTDNDYYDINVVYQDNSYSDKGFYFKSNRSYMLKQRDVAKPTVSMVLYTSGVGDQNSYFKAANNELFNLDSMTAGSYYAPVTVTGYDASNQLIGSVSFDNDGTRGVPVTTKILSWKNVSVVRVTSQGFAYLNLDDIAARIIAK